MMRFFFQLATFSNLLQVARKIALCNSTFRVCYAAAWNARECDEALPGQGIRIAKLIPRVIVFLNVQMFASFSLLQANNCISFVK